MISSILLVCSKCNNYLDTCNRLPRLLVGTGHTYCQICVENIIYQDKNGEQLTLENFPLNQTLINILQTSYSSFKNNVYDGQTSQRENLKDQNISRLLSDFESGEIPENLTTSFDEQSKNIHTPQGSMSKSKDGKQQYFQKPQFATSAKQNKNNLLFQETEDDEEEEDSRFLLRRSVNINENLNSFKQKSQKDLCRQHRKNADVVCIQCKEMVCANCALFGSHKGHDISSEEDVLLLLTERANDIMIKVESVKYIIDQITKDDKEQKLQNKTLEESRQLVLRVQTQFDNIRKMIDKEESKCLEQIHKIFNSDVENSTDCSYFYITQQINYANDWCLQARHAIESLADVKSGKYYYWDLLNISDSTANKGFNLQRDLNKLIKNMEDQIQKSTKNFININFNMNPLIIALEGFCRISHKAPIKQQQNDSNSLVDQLLTLDDSINKLNQNELKEPYFNEISDIMSKENESVIQVQFQVSKKNSRQTTPLQTSKTKTPSRLQKSKTPKKEPLQSLSPISNAQNLKSKKRSSILIQLPQKVQQMLEQLKSASFQGDQFDISGTDFNSDLAQYIGNEIKYSRVKSVKLMKCKMTDDQLEVFFDFLGNSNDGLCTLNLSQNNLSDKCIDIIKELQQQGRINKNLKSIVLSQNKINNRKNQQKITEIKRLGISLTL